LSKTRPNTTLVGVDGCHGGWLAVISTARGPVEAHVFDSFAEVIAGVNSTARFGVDIPMGLREVGVRACELEARRRLQRPRKSSVFPAPPKECLSAQSYEQACQICYRVEGKKMSRQAYGILPKIREVEHYLARHAAARRRIAEVHPEVSFATWQGGSGLAHSKKTAEGKLERRALIEQLWPDTVDRLRVRFGVTTTCLMICTTPLRHYGPPAAGCVARANFWELARKWIEVATGPPFWSSVCPVTPQASMRSLPLLRSGAPGSPPITADSTPRRVPRWGCLRCIKTVAATPPVC
jgi:predicted RNase H-like nuclease